MEVVGAELALNADIGARLGWGWSVSLGLVYSYTRGQFLTTFETKLPDWAPEVREGDKLPYLPEHQIGLSGGVTASRWTTFLSLAYVDAMRTTPGQGPIPENESTDANLVLDVTLGCQIRDGLGLRLQARNLTDEVFIVARRPRAIMIGIDWSL